MDIVQFSAVDEESVVQPLMLSSWSCALTLYSTTFLRSVRHRLMRLDVVRAGTGVGFPTTSPLVWFAAKKAIAAIVVTAVVAMMTCFMVFMLR